MRRFFRTSTPAIGDPGYRLPELVPSFGAPIFCYLLGTGFSAHPERDLYGKAGDLAVTGAIGSAGFQAATGTAFIDLPYNGRTALAAGGGAVTFTVLAKTSQSMLIVGDHTSQSPATEPRATMYRLPNASTDLFGATINDGTAAGGNSAASILNQTDPSQSTGWAIYTMMFTATTVQAAYRRSGYLNGAEQLGPIATKSDADPVGNPNGLWRLGRAFPGSNLPTNTNVYIGAHAVGGLLTAEARAFRDRKLIARLAEQGQAL